MIISFGNAGKRILNHTLTDDLTREESVRLLLDPCKDDPAEHLEYEPNGVIKAKLKGTRVSAKGKTSIEVYGLHRKDLVETRERFALDIFAQIKTVDDLLTIIGNTAKKNRPPLEALLANEIGKLKGFMAPKRPYTAMAKQFIEEFMKTRSLK